MGRSGAGWHPNLRAVNASGNRRRPKRTDSCGATATVADASVSTMNAGELTAWATAISVAVAVVFGAAGLVVGIVGLVQASRARAAAIGANEIAKQANEIATEANKLVEMANGTINEQAARDTERSDVAWEWRWDDPAHSDHVIIQNIGKNPAKDVVAQFFFEGAVEANPPMNVAGREEFRLDIPMLADRRKFAFESERTSVEWAVAQRIAGEIPIPPRSTARVRLRVTWVTPLGAPKLFDSGYSDESLLHNGH